MKQRRVLILSLLVVALLVGGCSLWVRQAKRQYALDRELIAALVHKDTKQALVLVNMGADPNTRLMPTPAPTLQQLLQQFLNHKPLPVEDSPTAFLVACGGMWSWSQNGSVTWVNCQEDLPLVRAMLLHGADANAMTTYREPGLIYTTTVLMCAVRNEDAAASDVQLLLEHRARVNVPDSEGMTALMSAASDGFEEKVGILLAYGANVNVQDTYGNTALHYAVTDNKDLNVIRQLLRHGPNVNLLNKRGETAITWAQREHRPDIVALLRKGGK